MAKRFTVTQNSGAWSVIDQHDGKRVVGYSVKLQAEVTAEGLNRIRKKENIEKMKKNLRTINGYGYYVRKHLTNVRVNGRIIYGQYVRNSGGRKKSKN